MWGGKQKRIILFSSIMSKVICDLWPSHSKRSGHWGTANLKNILLNQEMNNSESIHPELCIFVGEWLKDHFFPGLYEEDQNIHLQLQGLKPWPDFFVDCQIYKVQVRGGVA